MDILVPVGPLDTIGFSCFFADDPRDDPRTPEVPALLPAPQRQPQAASQQDEGRGQGVVCDAWGMGIFLGRQFICFQGKHSCCFFLWPFLSRFSLKKWGNAAVGFIPPHPRMQSLEPFTHL